MDWGKIFGVLFGIMVILNALLVIGQIAPITVAVFIFAGVNLIIFELTKE